MPCIVVIEQTTQLELVIDPTPTRTRARRLTKQKKPVVRSAADRDRQGVAINSQEMREQPIYPQNFGRGIPNPVGPAVFNGLKTDIRQVYYVMLPIYYLVILTVL